MTHDMPPAHVGIALSAPAGRIAAPAAYPTYYYRRRAVFD
jgi:hypothetical protein